MAGPPPLTSGSTLLFFKPYGVLSQFSVEPGSRWRSLAPFIPVPAVYAAGRLDADSEGLLLLTANGPLQRRLTDPACGHWRRYWVQVEGDAAGQPGALAQLRRGVAVQGRRTLPARVTLLAAETIRAAALPERDTPIRHRSRVPTSWIAMELREGRNRQVRRMTAAVGLPTLRLIRTAIDLMDGQPPLDLEGLQPGAWRRCDAGEAARLAALLKPRRSPGRAGLAGWERSGRAGTGG